jgi:hypothetical protein
MIPVIVVVLLLALAVVVVVAMDHGPGPGEVAVAYELAWDHLDFESLFTLSAAELRDGLNRRAFVAAKRAAYARQHELGGLVEQVGVDQLVDVRDAAVAITTVELHDGGVVHNRVEMVRRHGRWLVIEYRIEPSAEDAPRADG